MRIHEELKKVLDLDPTLSPFPNSRPRDGSEEVHGSGWEDSESECLEEPHGKDVVEELAPERECEEEGGLGDEVGVRVSGEGGFGNHVHRVGPKEELEVHLRPSLATPLQSSQHPLRRLAHYREEALEFPRAESWGRNGPDPFPLLVL